MVCIADMVMTLTNTLPMLRAFSAHVSVNALGCTRLVLALVLPSGLIAFAFIAGAKAKRWTAPEPPQHRLTTVLGIATFFLGAIALSKCPGLAAAGLALMFDSASTFARDLLLQNYGGSDAESTGQLLYVALLTVALGALHWRLSQPTFGRTA